VKFVTQSSIFSLADLSPESPLVSESYYRSATRGFEIIHSVRSECRFSVYPPTTPNSNDSLLLATRSFTKAQLRVSFPLRNLLRFDQFQLHFYPNESYTKSSLFLDEFRFQGPLLSNHAMDQMMNLDVICLSIFSDRRHRLSGPAPNLSYEIGLVLIPHDIYHVRASQSYS
jgi:hypothetical protein